MRAVHEGEEPSDESEAGTERDGGTRGWAAHLASIIGTARDESGARLYTTLSCNVRNGRPVLFLPPEMGSLQPRNLGYLRAFARRHGFGLVEDRRRSNLAVAVEQRSRTPTRLALGLSLLLRQTGMPGGARTLSSPHRLNADGLHLGICELIRMAAQTRPESKRVTLAPNRMIVDVTDDEHPITAHACRLVSIGGRTVLSQFESASFRCIGYAAGRQYVMHVLLAGGPQGEPELWSRLHTLTHTDFRFRLFPGSVPEDDFGLFHATYYFDLDGGDAPWWLAETDAADARGP